MFCAAALEPIPSPTIKIPPQSPGALFPETLEEVKHTGAAASPFVTILAPCSITKAEPAVPKITEPLSKVRVAPLLLLRFHLAKKKSKQEDSD